MAVAFTNRIAFTDSADASSYVTGSWTPASNKAHLIAVMSRASGTPDVPTLSGNGLTFTQLDTFLSTGSVWRLTLFKAHGIASPTTGAITITFAATQTGAMLICDETDANPTDPVNTSNKASVNDTGFETLSVVLGSAVAAGNGIWMAGGSNQNTALTGDANYTMLGNLQEGATARALMTQYDADGGDLSATFTSPGDPGRMIGWSIEVKAGGAGGDVLHNVTPLALALASVAVTVTGKASVPVTPKVVTLSQLAPTVSAAARFQTTPLLLTLSQLAASVGLGTNIVAATQLLNLSTATVVVSTGGDLAVAASVQTLLLSQLGSTVTGGARFDVIPPTTTDPERRLVVSMPARTVTGGASFQTTPLQLLLSSVSPTVTGKASVTVATNLLTLSMIHPTVTAGAGTPVSIAAATQILTLSLQLAVTTVQERNMYGIRTVVAGPIILR